MQSALTIIYYFTWIPEFHCWNEFFFQVINYTILTLQLEKTYTICTSADMLQGTPQPARGLQCFVPITQWDVMQSYRPSAVVLTSWLQQMFLPGVFVLDDKVILRWIIWFLFKSIKETMQVSLLFIKLRVWYLTWKYKPLLKMFGI